MILEILSLCLNCDSSNVIAGGRGAARGNNINGVSAVKAAGVAMSAGGAGFDNGICGGVDAVGVTIDTFAQCKGKFCW